MPTTPKLTDDQEFLVNNLKARMDHCFEVQWYTPEQTLANLIALHDMGLLIHYDGDSERPERYILIMSEAEKRAHGLELAKEAWLHSLTELDIAFSVFKRKAEAYIRIAAANDADLKAFWARFDKELRTIRGDLSALPITLNQFIAKQQEESEA